jgi:hypothetical protein
MGIECGRPAVDVFASEIFSVELIGADAYLVFCLPDVPGQFTVGLPSTAARHVVEAILETMGMWPVWPTTH